MQMDISNSNISTIYTDHSEQSESEHVVVHDFPGIIRVYSNGRVERLTATDFVPPSINNDNNNNKQLGVSSKDIIIDSQNNLSARLFLPQLTNNNNHIHNKVPLLLYFHGSAFCFSSPFTAKNHNYISALVAKSKVLAVSVHYRLAPEHPIPAAYEDAWIALQWIASHKLKTGPEAWLNEHADFERVFLAGDSAGANIVHNIAMVAGDPSLELGIDILGACLVHPCFWGSNPIGSEALDPDSKATVDRLWPFVWPSTADNDDPRINPVAEGAPSLRWLGCRRVLVCVAEKDILRDRGWLYYNALSRSGWMGVVEIEETRGEDHVFHTNDLECDNARGLIKCMAEFFNRGMPPSI